MKKMMTQITQDKKNHTKHRRSKEAETNEVEENKKLDEQVEHIFAQTKLKKDKFRIDKTAKTQHLDYGKYDAE